MTDAEHAAVTVPDDLIELSDMIDRLKTRDFNALTQVFPYEILAISAHMAHLRSAILSLGDVEREIAGL